MARMRSFVLPAWVSIPLSMLVRRRGSLQSDDQGPISPHGQNAREFALLVKAVQPGRYADLIAGKEDPLADIMALERVGFVMKGGQIVKSW